MTFNSEIVPMGNGYAAIFAYVSFVCHLLQKFWGIHFNFEILLGLLLSSWQLLFL
jgi:hypothetical protein